VSYWKRAPNFKPASFCSHLQAGFIVAAGGPQITSWHPTLWAVIAVAAGYAWEFGYWTCAWLRGPGPKIVCRLTGWPSIGRTWRVYMAHAEFNIDTEQLPRDDEGLVMRFRMRRAEDSAKPSALDIVPFIFGAGLGLLFACTR